MKKLLCSYFIFLFIVACGNQAGKKDNTSNDNTLKDQKSITKPPTIFSDTLKIDSKAAVFFYPDSLQLKKIMAGIDTSKFDAIIHEYYYQIRNAHSVLNKYWPKIKIVEAKNVRFLLFLGNYADTVIDINSINDTYGLFLFRPNTKPQYTDMYNIDTELGFYFMD